MVRLLSQVEAEKLEVVRKEEETTLASQRSQRDQEALLEARAQLESLDTRLLETQEQLEREVERRRSLEEEKERLEERLNRAGRREESGAQQVDGHSVRITESRPHIRFFNWSLVKKFHNSRVMKAILCFWAQQAAWHSEPTDRTKDWVFQQKTGHVLSAGSSASPHQDVSPTGPNQGPWRTVDKIVGKLHLVSSKVHSMTSKTPGR